VVYQLYAGFLLCEEDAMKVPRFVVDLLVAVLVGLLTWYLGAERGMGLAVGIAALFALETARMIPLIEKIYHQYEAVNTLLKEFQAPDKFSEVLLLHGLKDLGQLSQSSISVGKEDVRDFWRDCLARATSKWSVLTYALPDDTWGITSWSNKALAIQQERIVSDCTIERVFIFDNIDERNRLEHIMEDHSRRGIKVFWLLKNELLANKTANDCWKTIGSLDVAVVDDSWVYLTSLDEHRKMVGAKATKGANIVRAAALLISEARALAATKKNIVQVAMGGENAESRQLTPKILAIETNQSDAEFSPGTTDAELVISGENLTGAVLSSSSDLISLTKVREIPHKVEAKISVSPDIEPGEYELSFTTSGGVVQKKIPIKHKDAPTTLNIVYEGPAAPKLDPGKDGLLAITIVGKYLKGATVAMGTTSHEGLNVEVQNNSSDNQLRVLVNVSAATPSGEYELQVTNQSGKNSIVRFKVDR
jgi:hypothetical protein